MEEKTEILQKVKIAAELIPNLNTNYTYATFRIIIDKRRELAQKFLETKDEKYLETIERYNEDIKRVLGL